jgi:hypothetical protein
MARGLAGAVAGLMIVGRDQSQNTDAAKELTSLRHGGVGRRRSRCGMSARSDRRLLILPAE